MATHYRQYPSGMREVVVQEPVPTYQGVHRDGSVTVIGGSPVYGPHRTAPRSRYQQQARDMVDLARLIISTGMVAGACYLVARAAAWAWPSIPTWALWVGVASAACIWVARDA